MEVYTRGYKCPYDTEIELQKKPKACSNPEKLSTESDKIIISFEKAIQLLEDFKIPREFYGFEPVNRPNFNLPENITVQGFKNHFADLKIEPTVKVMFSTLKADEDDVLNGSNGHYDKFISEAKNSDSNLFNYYLDKTKNRLIQKVKNINKKVNRRKKKDANKEKFLNSPEYDEMYKSYWSKVYDI